MKRMSFTNSRWYSLIGKSSLLVAFLLCFAGQPTATAQVKAGFGSSNTCVTDKLSSCSGDVTDQSTQFLDDGTNDGNYADTRARQDTVEFCPQDAWHFVKVVFTKFDLEDSTGGGDTLFVYDGDKVAVRGGLAPTEGATGVGVSAAFGGWVDANCDPADNPSGCLTFLLKTDGDNAKGAGWDAWVDCASRNVEISAPNISSVKLTCDDVFGEVTVPAATFTNTPACANVEDSVRVVIRNQHGDVCVDTCLTNSGVRSNYVGDFAIGSYLVDYTLKSDTEKTASANFSVQAPALVCNDNVTVPLGSACMVVLTPDDVLESPCDTNFYLQFGLKVTLPGANGAKDVVLEGTSAGGYPIVTADDVKAAGQMLCNGTAIVEVTRTYYGDRDGDGNPEIPAAVVCDNGVQTASCSTTLNFLDQSIPWINVPAVDTLIACDADALEDILAPTGVDNCDDDVEIEFDIVLEETDPCFAANGSPDTTRAIVTFTAVDNCSNVNTTTREYVIIRPFEFTSTENVEASCDDDDATAGMPGLRTGTLKNGVPVYTDTVELSTEEYICGYILSSRDIEVPATDCGRKIFRFWSALDWCAPENGPSAIDTTFIEFLDTEAPSFDDGEGANTVIELGHFECTFDINKATVPSASDNCDANPDVRLDRVRRIEDGGFWTIDPSDFATLDCDSFELRWIAEDDCHEQLVNDTLIQIVEIKDVTDPSAVAVDQLNISIPNEWGARVSVDDIDAGSYDACGIALREIRISGKNESWAQFVDIGCGFVHSDLQIELRITDNKGNQNIAWTDIIVEDKIAPVCNDLPPANRFCDEFHNGELGASTDANGDRQFSNGEWQPLTGALLATYNANFGAFDCQDNLNIEVCGSLTTTEEYQLIEWPCGEVQIRRRIAVEDWSGNRSNYATQSITISYRAGWSFTVPSDWDGDCGDQAIAPELTIDNGACDLLGFEVTERLFEVPGDACWKLERTYSIINWCTYQAGEAPVELARVEGEHGFAEGFTITSEGNETAGHFTYIQVLKIHDDEGPVVTVTDPEPCINGIDFDAVPHGEEDITPGSAPYECDEPKTWTATATDCSDASAITFEGRLYNAAGELVATSNTNSITFAVTNKSSYRAEFWAFDGCGNSGGASGDLIDFWDCKKPTPYAINGVAVELMETGSIQIWATDVDQGSFDNCTDQSRLDLRIYHEVLGDEPTDIAGVLDLPKVIELGCNELGTQNVQLYVIDEEENFDFVQTYVLVQDNTGACSNVEPNLGGMVAGKISDPAGEDVSLVSISVNGAEERTMMTENDGHYMFVLPQGGDYTVTPQKDMNHLNGVSTFDLVLISKHILGITPFDTPYKYIAADVNKSGSITAFDMVQLRQLILNITSEFPNNDSWRFIESGYEFSTSNPSAESFNEFTSINNLSGEMMDIDFTAVKIGDVNGNALANNLLGAESRSTVGKLNLTVADRYVESGETVTVAFSSADIAKVSGYQFTLNVTGSASLVEGVSKAANFNTTTADQGVLTTSWNGEASANDVLFSLTITATNNGLLSEMLSITSSVTTAEAYTTDGELLNVGINFTAAAVAGFELGQNTPNPFKGETVIGFNLPQSGQATLKVMDVQGKVIQQITADYAKGYNQVSLNSSELGSTGVLYYQLESADNVATKKMIIIE